MKEIREERLIWAIDRWKYSDVDIEAEIEKLKCQRLGKCYNCPGYLNDYVGCVADPCLKEKDKFF